MIFLLYSEPDDLLQMFIRETIDEVPSLAVASADLIVQVNNENWSNTLKQIQEDNVYVVPGVMVLDPENNGYHFVEVAFHTESSVIPWLFLHHIEGISQEKYENFLQ